MQHGNSGDIWIVYHDSWADNNILGVFDSAEEAMEFQEQVSPEFPHGALLTPFHVPWRYNDHVTELTME